jgi:hypothetical protein
MKQCNNNQYFNKLIHYENIYEMTNKSYVFDYRKGKMKDYQNDNDKTIIITKT